MMINEGYDYNHKNSLVSTVYPQIERDTKLWDDKGVIMTFRFALILALPQTALQLMNLIYVKLVRPSS